MIINQSSYNKVNCFKSFNSKEVDIFWTEYNNYLKDLPSNEKEKYYVFLHDKRFRFIYMQIYKHESFENSKFYPYSFQFDGPDDMFLEGRGPKVFEYNKITKNIPQVYSYLNNKNFSLTRQILADKAIYKTGTLIIYKPSAIILPHIHNEDNIIQHTLLNDISPGEFNFWHSYSSLTAKNKCDSFQFYANEVHFAECSGDACFLALDKFKN